MPKHPQERIKELLPDLMKSPRLYLHSLDMAQGAGLVIEADPAFYRNAVFLDERILNENMTGAWVPLDILWQEMDRRQGEPLPCHFIFHVGHAGSTLISRLLDEVPGVLGLREPVPLRALAMAKNLKEGQGTDIPQPNFDDVLERVYALLARRFEPDKAVIIKGTSVCCNLAPELLGMHRDNRALALTVGLEVFLANMLDKDALKDIPAFAENRIKGLKGRVANFDLNPEKLSPPELIALSWLAEAQALYVIGQKEKKRTLFLDFDDFLGNREKNIQAILDHFGLDSEKWLTAKLSESKVFQGYAKKPDFPYTYENRQAILNESRNENRADIRTGLEFAENLGKKFPVFKKALDYFVHQSR